MITQKRPLISARTALDKVPRDWLIHIEPRIARKGFAPCWIWCHTHSDRGYPMLKVDGEDVKARSFIAAMFWASDQPFKVQMGCGRRNCVNPNHFVLRSRKVPHADT